MHSTGRQNRIELVNNTASQGSGGAIYSSMDSMDINVQLVIDQIYFNNNTASCFGGALYVNGTNSSVSVTDSTFINNAAITEGGGAIYSDGQYANVTLTSITTPPPTAVCWMWTTITTSV